MKTFDDIPSGDVMRALIWAPPGAGKTALASTFPGFVFIDTDRGLATLKSKWYRDTFGKPDMIGFETFDNEYDRYGVFKNTDAFWKMLDFVNSLEKKPEVKTVILDSISTFQVLAMQIGMQAAGANKRSKTVEIAKSTHVLLPTQADFGAEMSVLEQFMNQLIKFNMNVVCIAHEREVTNETGSLLRREPYLIGSAIRAQVAKWFDEVWYIDVERDGKRKLLTQQTNIMKVNKSRHGVPNGLENPTYKKIMEAIK